MGIENFSDRPPIPSTDSDENLDILRAHSDFHFFVDDIEGPATYIDSGIVAERAESAEQRLIAGAEETEKTEQ
jgi:hypothetical protein